MCPNSVVNHLRRLCQKPARPDAYPLLQCSRGATVCETFSLPARLSGDTLLYCVAIVSPMRNQKVTLGTTADERLSPVIAVNSVTEDTKPTAESDSTESTDSKIE